MAAAVTYKFVDWLDMYAHPVQWHLIGCDWLNWWFSVLLLQAIGEDLFAIALDQPFRFPANFTFVLRAFSTLEVSCRGIASAAQQADMLLSCPE